MPTWHPSSMPLFSRLSSPSTDSLHLLGFSDPVFLRDPLPFLEIIFFWKLDIQNRTHYPLTAPSTYRLPDLNLFKTARDSFLFLHLPLYLPLTLSCLTGTPLRNNKKRRKQASNCVVLSPCHLFTLLHSPSRPILSLFYFWFKYSIKAF